MDCRSSCGPQPYSQPPPPIAQAPKPMRVKSRSVLPSTRLFKAAFQQSRVESEDEGNHWSEMARIRPALRKIVGAAHVSESGGKVVHAPTHSTRSRRRAQSFKISVSQTGRSSFLGCVRALGARPVR